MMMGYSAWEAKIRLADGPLFSCENVTVDRMIISEHEPRILIVSAESLLGCCP